MSKTTTEGNPPIIVHKVGHHFDDAKQEFESAHLGMWVFLAQEILFFSALFVAYGVFRYLYPEMFFYASKILDWKLGALNTIVLIFSSFTMVMAVRSVQLNQRKSALLYLAITIGCALAFLGVKVVEYSHKIHEGFLPSNFFFATIDGVGTSVPGIEVLNVYFGIYFALTGLHGIHILIGVGLLIWIFIKTKRGEFYDGYFTPVEMVGLYWHLVDLIWIFLFPLLYLI